MGGAGRPIHYLARELLKQGHHVLFVEVVAGENAAPQKNFQLLNFGELGYDETALRRAWFGLDPHIDSRPALVRALDAFESPNAARVVVYGDPFVPFVEWFNTFRAREYKIVYDALDDFQAFPEIGLYFTSLDAEKFLVASSDVVVAVSSTLVEKLTPWRTHAPVHLLRQGFDAETFRPTPPTGTAPPARNSNSLTLGFWGHVNAFNVDVALIEFVARARPQWTIQLIGPIDRDPHLPPVQERLRALPNVQLIGQVAHAELPRYLQTFDAALIPFPDNSFNRARDPLKAFEYLSGCKPIIASNTPQLAGMLYVYLANTPQEFLESIERAVALPVDRAQVNGYLENSTWHNRLHELLGWLTSAEVGRVQSTPQTKLWYVGHGIIENLLKYVERTELLLDERTRYIESLERDSANKQTYIHKLQSSNPFWQVKRIISQK